MSYYGGGWMLYSVTFDELIYTVTLGFMIGATVGILKKLIKRR